MASYPSINDREHDLWKKILLNSKAMAQNADQFEPSDIPGLGLWYSAGHSAFDAYTYEQAIPTLFDRSGNGWDATQSTGTAQARFLTHDGRNYLRLPGIAGNDVSTTKYIPGAGVFRVEANLRFVDYTPGATSIIAGVFATTLNQRSWQFSLQSTGHLRFTGRPTGLGTGGISISSTEVVPDQTLYVAVSCDFANGTLDFYTSVDGVTWTLLGTQQSFTPFTVFDSNALLHIGSVDAGTQNLMQAQVYWVKIYYNGTMVRYFDPSLGNFNSATIGSATGETWTINRTGLDPAMIVSARAFLPLTDDFYNIAAGAAGVLQNVGGGTMICARACNSVGAILDTFTMGTNSAQLARMNLICVSGSYSVGGRREDANSYQSVSAANQAYAEFAVQAGRLDYDAALAGLFKNGVQAGSDAAFQTAGKSSNTASVRMRVFASITNTPSNFHSGPVTDLLLYNRALTNAEIFKLSDWMAAQAGIA